MTPRQSSLLRKVVESHVALGSPVGSKWLAEQDDNPWGPSTIRAELARLEEMGVLRHPHTSAGRVPTDRGYRLYVDEILESPALPRHVPPFELSLIRREVDDAMRAATERLSQVTDLLAIVSAPPIATTTIRHVEVLLLQPQVAMVVVITSTGGVSKRVIPYGSPVDAGLVDWARSYLNEALGGMSVGARMVQRGLTGEGLSLSERDFLATLAPAFLELEETVEHSLYVDGTARLLSEDRVAELSQINDLMALLERRVALLSVLRSALEESSVYLRIGEENETPALHSISIVAANYGLPGRNLGAVSVLGPVRMDYPKAIAAVRRAADELSRFAVELYE
ncbi:MAG: heat-inducible transcriptional repressor HrcA [Thermoleophilaceae bacterium]